jgi:hypothetical protein
MNMKRVLVIALVLIAAAIAASAQSVYTPEKGSPERKAILDALRVPVERAMKQKIVFVADKFSVQGTWAFVGGSMQTPSGDQPDLTGTEFAEAAKEGFYDSNFFGLLRKTGGKWRVIKHAIGCTDVCYAEWWKEARAPKAIFDITY